MHTVTNGSDHSALSGGSSTLPPQTTESAILSNPNKIKVPSETLRNLIRNGHFLGLYQIADLIFQEGNPNEIKKTLYIGDALSRGLLEREQATLKQTFPHGGMHDAALWFRANIHYSFQAKINRLTTLLNRDNIEKTRHKIKSTMKDWQTLIMRYPCAGPVEAKGKEDYINTLITFHNQPHIMSLSETRSQEFKKEFSLDPASHLSFLGSIFIEAEKYFSAQEVQNNLQETIDENTILGPYNKLAAYLTDIRIKKESLAAIFPEEATEIEVIYFRKLNSYILSIDMAVKEYIQKNSIEPDSFLLLSEGAISEDNLKSLRRKLDHITETLIIQHLKAIEEAISTTNSIPKILQKLMLDRQSFTKKYNSPSELEELKNTIATIDSALEAIKELMTAWKQFIRVHYPVSEKTECQKRYDRYRNEYNNALERCNGLCKDKNIQLSASRIGPSKTTSFGSEEIRLFDGESNTPLPVSNVPLKQKPTIKDVASSLCRSITQPTNNMRVSSFFTSPEKAQGAIPYPGKEGRKTTATRIGIK